MNQRNCLFLAFFIAIHARKIVPLEMKNKDKKPYQKEKSAGRRVGDPNKKSLEHIQNQARMMAEVLGVSQGERYIKEALKDFDHLIKGELKKFNAKL